MSQPPWPFPHPNGGVPIAFGGNVSSASINTAYDVVNVAADGRLWTDLSLFKNWKYIVGNGGLPNSGVPQTPNARIAAYDPASRRFFTFGTTASADSFCWSVSGAKWFGPFTISGFASAESVEAAHCNPAGVMLLGVTDPANATTQKLVETTDGGANFTIRNIGASDFSIVHSIVYVQSLGLWLASKNIPAGGESGIWSSTDRITWTKRTGSYGVLIVREAPTRILAINGVSGAGTGYTYSDDGINWTSQTLPVNYNTSSFRGLWSDAYGKFFTQTASGIYSSATGLTGSWTLVSSFNSSSVAGFGRVLFRGDGKASVDGGANWVQVADVDTSVSNLEFHAFSGVGVLAVRQSTDEVFLSQVAGF